VDGTGNTQFDVSFQPLTALGNYAVTVGPDVRNLQGTAMNQDRDATAGEAVADKYNGTFTLRDVMVFSSPGLPKTIRDVQTITSTRTVTRTDLYIGDVNVQVTLSHSWVGDLRLWLKGPGNREVLL